MESKGMKKFMIWMFVLSALSMVIVFLWDTIPAIKNTANFLLNPTAGALINWNVTGGTLIVFFIICLLTTIIQKYTTDQKALKELREEQKKVQKEMQDYKDNPEKMLEINKKNMKLMGDTMSLTMKSSFITFIPLILLFRWFSDTFTALGNPKVLLGLSWIWIYFLSFLVFSSLLRKWLKVV